jgi:hypothetical protein
MPSPSKRTAFSFARWARSGWSIAALLLFAVLALGNIRLLSGNAAPQWDAVDFFAPQLAFVKDQIASGHFPKWNPWVGGGVPDWADPELGTTSPVVLAASLLAINPQEGFIAYWLAVWAFGGVGMLLLTRHLRAPAWGGAVATLGFVASGFYTGHAEHMSSLYSVSFLPWILWRLDAAIEHRDWWRGVQAGFLYGLSALGGYPAFTILTPGFLFLWVLGRVVWRDSGTAGSGKRPAPGLAALLLAVTIGVGFVIFIPSYSGVITGTSGFSDRVGPRPRQEVTSSNMLAAGAISTFASPYLANLNRPPRGPWPETDISMTSIYTGAASLILALLGWRRRSGWRWWLVLMGVFFACCALGSQLPLRGWLYDFVPPTRYFRGPALCRGYVIFLIGILAALGARDLAEAPPSAVDRGRLWSISIWLACSSAVAFFVVVRVAAAFPGLPLAIVHLIAVWFGFAALAYAVKEGQLSVPRFLRFAAMLALLDAACTLQISQPTLYTSATLSWWHEMNAQHESSLDLGLAGMARVLEPPDSLGAYQNNRNLLPKIPVFDSFLTLMNRFQEAMAADPVLARMAVGPGRLWFSSVAARRPPDNASFKVFQERVRAQAGVPILIVHSPEQMRGLSTRRVFRWRDAIKLEPGETAAPVDVPACFPAVVSDVSYEPDSLAFRYVAPERGYLLVTDRWAEGWEATVNGRPRPVLGGDFIFRALEVEPGANVIQFLYKPRWFLPLATWSALLLIAAWQCRRMLPARKKIPVAASIAALPAHRQPAGGKSAPRQRDRHAAARGPKSRQRH